jgi:hypothetical protein
VRSGRSFVYLCGHLARAGLHDPHSIDLILAEADKCDLSDLDSDLGLANAIDFLFRLNIPFVKDVSDCSSYVLKFIERNRLLCLNSLLQARGLRKMRILSFCLKGSNRDPTSSKKQLIERHKMSEAVYHKGFQFLISGGRILCLLVADLEPF